VASRVVLVAVGGSMGEDVMEGRVSNSFREPRSCSISISMFSIPSYVWLEVTNMDRIIIGLQWGWH
jgi:hypothetical protein